MMRRVNTSYHDHDPVTAQKYGFASEQVDAPEAILDVPDEGQPGRAVGSGVARPVVLREHAGNDIFVNLDPEGMSDLLGNADIAELGITALHLDDRRNEFGGWAFGPGLRRMDEEEKSRRYLQSTSALWNWNNVAGLRIAESFAIRCGLTKRVGSPNRKRSRVLRFGARCRERLLIRS